MEMIEIRPIATRRELEQALTIWETVFPEDRFFFQNRLDHDKTYSMETTWIALVDGIIAAAIQIFPFRMRWGCTQLKVGGIGNVATLPEYRSRGLAQQILCRQSEFMKKHDYDLSLLMTGIHSFYEQIGWHTIADKELIAEIGTLRGSGSTNEYQARVYEPQDLTPVMQIYDEMNHERTAAMVRTKEYWQGQFAWKTVEPGRFLVAENSGQVVAYVRYKLTKEHQILLKDCCYKAGKEQAALLLLHSAIEKEEDASTVRAILPSDHALYEYLQKNGTLLMENSKMWKAFDFTRTISTMAPEFTRRVKQIANKHDIELPAVILLRVGDQEALVRIREQNVEVQPVTEAVRYNIAYKMSDAEWIALMLGGCEALDNEQLKGSSYLRILFQGKPCVFWNADHF